MSRSPSSTFTNFSEEPPNRVNSTTPISTDHLHVLAMVLLQPGGERRSVPVGQQIEDAMLVEIHQNRAVVAATSEGESIDAQGAQVGSELTGARDHSATHQPQQGVTTRPARVQAQVSREALPRLPSQGEADGFQPLPQDGCPPLIGRCHLRQALAKRNVWRGHPALSRR